jgi:hypothetical protein
LSFVMGWVEKQKVAFGQGEFLKPLDKFLNK